MTVFISGAPGGFPRHCVLVGHSLALKLRNACFRLLIVELRSNLRCVPTVKTKTPPLVMFFFLFWRTRRDSNAQSPPSEGDALSS